MKYYTGVGSRSTPKEYLEVIKEVAKALGELGYCLRSGGADGADKAFEEGCDDVRAQKRIYIPWNTFNGYDDKAHKFVKVTGDSEEGEAIAREIHPAWENLKQGGKRLHIRNTNQVLGDDLHTPSKFLIFYAKEDRQGNVSGGTRTAVELAK